jgi:hypothetical protein
MVFGVWLKNNKCLQIQDLDEDKKLQTEKEKRKVKIIFHNTWENYLIWWELNEN